MTKLFKFTLTRTVASGTLAAGVPIPAGDIDLSSLTYQTYLPKTGAISFQLVDIGACAVDALRSLFEQFQLAGVSVKFTPFVKGTDWEQIRGAGIMDPQYISTVPQPFVSAFDPDDADLTQYLQLIQRFGRKMTVGRTNTRYIKPKIRQIVQLAELPVDEVYRPLRAPWLDLQSDAAASIGHYAYKYSMDESVLSSVVPPIVSTSLTGSMLGGAPAGNPTAPGPIDSRGLVYGVMHFNYYVKVRRVIECTEPAAALLAGAAVVSA